MWTSLLPPGYIWREEARSPSTSAVLAAVLGEKIGSVLRLRSFCARLKTIPCLCFFEKVSNSNDFPTAPHRRNDTDLPASPDLPGLAQLCAVLRCHGVGSKLYSSHAPTSQSATKPLGRQLAYQIPDSNLNRFSQHCMQIACNYKGFSILQGGTKTTFSDFCNPSEQKP